MHIEIEQTESGGSWYIEKDGKRVAEMVFSKAGEKIIIIEHTEVGNVLRGTGAGRKLVAEAVAFARINNLKILPLCQFAKSVFDKTPEYEDVRSK